MDHDESHDVKTSSLPAPGPDKICLSLLLLLMLLFSYIHKRIERDNMSLIFYCRKHSILLCAHMAQCSCYFDLYPAFRFRPKLIIFICNECRHSAQTVKSAATKRQTNANSQTTNATRRKCSNDAVVKYGGIEYISL